MSTQEPHRDGDPELVIQQAMRALAGGRREDAAGSPGGEVRHVRWSVTQILLLVAIVGLVLGMAAAFVVLLTR